MLSTTFCAMVFESIHLQYNYKLSIFCVASPTVLLRPTSSSENLPSKPFHTPGYVFIFRSYNDSLSLLWMFLARTSNHFTGIMIQFHCSDLWQPFHCCRSLPLLEQWIFHIHKSESHNVYYKPGIAIESVMPHWPFNCQLLALW